MPDPLMKKFTIKHFQEFCDEFGATCPLLFRDVLVLLKAQPGIVRCKECKHRSKELYDYCGNPKDKRYVCQVNDVAKKPDWFCADGEREVNDMSRAYQCDRCKKLYADEPLDGENIEIMLSVYHYATDEAIKQDLCPSCEKELIRWLKKGGESDA